MESSGSRLFGYRRRRHRCARAARNSDRLNGTIAAKPDFGTQGTARASDTEVIPFTEDHGRSALRAYMKFGKGRHPAALNFGDCLSYATAFVARQPLLFVGGDFSKTDIPPA